MKTKLAGTVAIGLLLAAALSAQEPAAQTPNLASGEKTPTHEPDATPPPPTNEPKAYNKKLDFSRYGTPLEFIKNGVYVIAANCVGDLCKRRTPQYEIVIDNKIDDDTVAGFISALGSEKIQQQKSTALVELNSPGGEVMSAMQIGRIIRSKNLMTTISGKDRCLSACVFILAAGVKRMVGGTVGIHRPHFDEQKFAALPIEEARAKYQLMASTIRTYLQEMGLPDSLFEHMQQISSDDILLLSPREVKAYGLDGEDAAYMEWVRAKAVSSEGIDDYNKRVEFQNRYASCLNQTNGNWRYCQVSVHRDAP